MISIAIKKMGFLEIIQFFKNRVKIDGYDIKIFKNASKRLYICL